MQSILNKKVVLLLCFTLNIVHFIECSTQSNPSEEHSNEPAQVPLVTDSAKNVRNAVMGGVQHNYRSSYVGNRLNRRVATATAKQVEVTTTEHTPLIKTKRKLTNEFSDVQEIKYNVGPGVNIGVEKEKELVSVYLDEDCLKDVFTGNMNDFRTSLLYFLVCFCMTTIYR